MSDVVLGGEYAGPVECISDSKICLATIDRKGLNYIIQTVGTQKRVYLVIAKNEKVKTFDDFNHYVKIAQSKFGNDYVQGTYRKNTINYGKIVNGSNVLKNSGKKSICWGECITTKYSKIEKLNGGDFLAETGVIVAPINGIAISFDEINNEKFSITMKCDSLGKQFLSQIDVERQKEIADSSF